MSAAAQQFLAAGRAAAAAAERNIVPVVTNLYQQTLKDGAQYVVKDPEAAAKLPKQLFYTTLDG